MSRLSKLIRDSLIGSYWRNDVKSTTNVKLQKGSQKLIILMIQHVFQYRCKHVSFHSYGKVSSYLKGFNRQRENEPWCGARCDYFLWPLVIEWATNSPAPQSLDQTSPTRSETTVLHSKENSFASGAAWTAAHRQEETQLDSRVSEGAF